MTDHKSFLCTGAPDVFFSDEPDGENVKTLPMRRIDVEFAKFLCGICLHQEACAELALADPTRRGIYGGLTTQERACMQKRCRHPEHRLAAA